MTRSKIGHVVIRLLAFFLGLFIIQIAVAIFLKVNLGSDPFTVFTQGLAKVIHTTPGMANRIITIVLLLFVFFLDRKMVKLGTIIIVAIAGTFLDFSLRMLSPFINASLPMYIKLLLFFLGCLIVGIGFTLLKSADYGIAPNDAMYFILVDRLKKKYGIVRMGVDSIYMLIGFLLGGVIGIGTVCSVLFIGPVIQFIMGKLNPYLIKYFGLSVNA